MNDRPIDAITKGWLEAIAQAHPLCAIQLSHQFLDGEKKHECGFVPNDWNGKKLYFERETV